MSLVGCSGAPAGDQENAVKVATSTNVQLAGPLEPTDMALYHGVNRMDKVRVGDSWAFAKEVFPEPPRGAYEVHDLPNQFTEKFEAEGWETNRDEGFGAILVENKLAAAVYQLDKERATTVDPYIEQELESLRPLNPTTLGKGAVKYWFWHDRNQTTMICRFENKGTVNLTMAMGDDNVLKELGMSEPDAKKQIADITPPMPAQNAG